MDQASPASTHTQCTNFCVSTDLHHQGYTHSTTLHRHLHMGSTKIQKIFFLPPSCFFSFYTSLTPFFQPLSLSLTTILGIMVKKKCSLLHFPHLLPSHAFSAPLQQCACTLFDVKVGERKSGGEAKL